MNLEGILENRIFYIGFVSFEIIVVILLSVFGMAGLAINFLLSSVIIVSAIYFINRFFEYKKIKTYEDAFPDFLRDLSESLFAGLTLIQAIHGTAESDYGPLSREIRKMANQLSWNFPLEKVLEDFRKRTGKSGIINRSVLIINQAQKSGGNLENILNSLAIHIEKIRDVEAEKSTLLGQQVMMMYAIFFIFMGISIALVKFLVPMLEMQTEEMSGLMGLGFFQGGGNPCQECVGSSNFACFSCNIFFHVSSTFNFGQPEEASAYYKSLFFLMILIQGFFSGLVAGQIGSDSIVAGVKHSLMMVVSGFIIFLMANAMGLI